MAAVGVGLIFGLVIGSLVGAVLLRAAVALANKILGPQAAPDPNPSFAENHQHDSPGVTDPANPYSAPAMAATATEATGATLAIPTPTFGKALGIAAVLSILGFVISFGAGVIGQASPAVDLVVRIGSLGVNFLTASLVFTKLLPTTFRRAALVYVMYLVIAGLIGGALIGLGFLFSSLA